MSIPAGDGETIFFRGAVGRDVGAAEQDSGGARRGHGHVEHDVALVAGRHDQVLRLDGEAQPVEETAHLALRMEMVMAFFVPAHAAAEVPAGERKIAARKHMTKDGGPSAERQCPEQQPQPAGTTSQRR